MCFSHFMMLPFFVTDDWWTRKRRKPGPVIPISPLTGGKEFHQQPSIRKRKTNLLKQNMNLLPCVTEKSRVKPGLLKRIKWCDVISSDFFPFPGSVSHYVDLIFREILPCCPTCIFSVSSLVWRKRCLFSSNPVNNLILSHWPWTNHLPTPEAISMIRRMLRPMSIVLRDPGSSGRQSPSSVCTESKDGAVPHVYILLLSCGEDGCRRLMSNISTRPSPPNFWVWLPWWGWSKRWRNSRVQKGHRIRVERARRASIGPFQLPIAA